MVKEDLKEIIERFDKLIALVEGIAKPESNAKKIIDGIIAVVTITGIISIIDIIKGWIGG
jgi:hypothetical protein